MNETERLRLLKAVETIRAKAKAAGKAFADASKACSRLIGHRSVESQIGKGRRSRALR